MNKLGQLFWWLNGGGGGGSAAGFGGGGGGSSKMEEPQVSPKVNTPRQIPQKELKDLENTFEKAPRVSDQPSERIQDLQDGTDGIKIGDKLCYVEHFDSIRDFLVTIHKRPNSKIFNGRNESDGRYPAYVGFTATENLKEAEKLLVLGWEEGLKKIKGLSTTKINDKKNTSPRSQLVNSPIGFSPNVPHALMSLPNSMVYRKPAPRTTRTINIKYFTTCPHYISQETMMQAGLALVEAISAIEKHRISVKLEYSPYAGHTYREAACCLVKLKDYGEKINLLKVCFPIAHPSSLRRTGFKWLETYPYLTHENFTMNYGKSVIRSEDAKKISKIKEDAIYFTTSQIIKDFNCDASKIIEYINKECLKKESQGS